MARHDVRSLSLATFVALLQVTLSSSMSPKWLHIYIFQLTIADMILHQQQKCGGSLTCYVLQDETIKYQAALRTMDIFAKKHSVQHDIITGHPLVANYIIPPKPALM